MPYEKVTPFGTEIGLVSPSEAMSRQRASADDMVRAQLAQRQMELQAQLADSAAGRQAQERIQGAYQDRAANDLALQGSFQDRAGLQRDLSGTFKDRAAADAANLQTRIAGDWGLEDKRGANQMGVVGLQMAPANKRADLESLIYQDAAPKRALENKRLGFQGQLIDRYMGGQQGAPSAGAVPGGDAADSLLMTGLAFGADPGQLIGSEMADRRRQAQEARQGQVEYAKTLMSNPETRQAGLEILNRAQNWGATPDQLAVMGKQRPEEALKMQLEKAQLTDQAISQIPELMQKEKEISDLFASPRGNIDAQMLTSYMNEYLAEVAKRGLDPASAKMRLQKLVAQRAPGKGGDLFRNIGRAFVTNAIPGLERDFTDEGAQRQAIVGNQ